MVKWRRMLSLCSALLGLQACGDKGSQDQSQLALTNAIAIDEKEYAAVVMLFRPLADAGVYCTGAFVNDHQVLTAAHCLSDRGDDRSQIYYVQPQTDASGKKTMRIMARALRAHVQESFDESARLPLSSDDLAVLDFPGGSAPATLRLSRKTPTPFDRVTLVGYGAEESEKSGHQGSSTIGDKRYGSNTIKSSLDGLVSLSGLAHSRSSYPLGQHVASAQGDSGSPWLIDGQLSGITIGAEVKEMGRGQELSITYAVDLSSASSRSFLSSTVF